MLTDEELARVRAAYEQERTWELFKPALPFRPREMQRRLEAVLKAWNALSSMEQLYLSGALADLCNIRSSLGDDLVDLNVGLAVRRLLEESKVGPGAPSKEPGLRAAVRELFLIWVEQGNPPEIGQLRREKGQSDLHPYDSLKFVAEGILQLLPAVYATTRDPQQRRRRLLSEVDTQLRTLREFGQIPG